MPETRSTRPLLCHPQAHRCSRSGHLLLDLCAIAGCAHLLLQKLAPLPRVLLARCPCPTACNGHSHSGRTGRCPGQQSAAPVLPQHHVAWCLHRTASVFARHQGLASRRSGSCVVRGVTRALVEGENPSPSGRTIVCSCSGRRGRRYGGGTNTRRRRCRRCRTATRGRRGGRSQMCTRPSR